MAMKFQTRLGKRLFCGIWMGAAAVANVSWMHLGKETTEWVLLLFFSGFVAGMALQIYFITDRRPLGIVSRPVWVSGFGGILSAILAMFVFAAMAILVVNFSVYVIGSRGDGLSALEITENVLFNLIFGLFVIPLFGISYLGTRILPVAFVAGLGLQWVWSKLDVNIKAPAERG